MPTQIYIRPIGADTGFTHQSNEDVSTEELIQRAKKDGYLMLQGDTGDRAYPLSSIAFIETFVRNEN